MRKNLFIGLLLSCIVNLGAQSFSLPSEKSLSELRKTAFSYNEIGKYDEAIEVYKEIIELQTAINKYYDKYTAYAFLNLASTYKRLYHLQTALELLNKCEDILTEIDPDSYYFTYIYNNKANIYYDYSDFDEAEMYYKYSLGHFIKLDSINNDAFNMVYLNLFNLFINQGRLDEAQKLLTDIKELNVSKPEAIITKNMFLSQAYDRFGELKLSTKYLNLARKNIIDFNYNDPDLQIELNFRSASIYTKQNNLDEASEYLLDNLALIQSNSSVMIDFLKDTYLSIGKLHLNNKEYKTAYYWYTEAIKRLDKKFKTINLELNTNKSKVLDYIYLDIKHLLAITCVQLYSKENNKEYLYQAIKLYSEVIESLKIFRIHMKNEGSKLRNTEEKISIIQEAINLALNMYNITGEKQYLDSAFLYTENTKSFVLLSEIRNNEAIQFSDLPEEIVEKEERLSSEIDAYEEMIFSEKTSENPDSALLFNLNEKLFHLKDDFNTLYDSIETFYPKYFHLKYNPEFITLEEIQGKIGRKEALVEYVLSDTILTTFIVDQEQIKVLTQNIEHGFSDDCINYLTLLSQQDFSSNVHQTYHDYVTIGRKLYNTLVKPVLEITDRRDITFVPDGAIMYIPFESLITQDVDDQYINYRDMPYLIYDIAVGYSYSSTLLFSDRIKHKLPEERVLAFAPSYDNLLDQDETLTWNRQANPDLLMPLPGAIKEVENIAKFVPADIYLNEDATEARFKELASNYSVLHLAMHTIMNDEDPMFSKLAFTRDFNDSLQDHDLFTYEIYNMNLNADMVVLSSCSSGFGKMSKGEGMMSLSRGFIYAGCPSIVMTLWQVSDKSSSDLMSGFYKYLKRGNSKKNALRKSKIDFIKSSDNLKSNPYFWSAFMIVGDSSPLFRAKAGTVLGIIILSFLLFTIYFSYRNRIRKRKL